MKRLRNEVIPVEVVRKWLEDNLGIAKPSQGGHGLHYNYNDFLVEHGKDTKKKLSINVEDGPRLGLWIGYKSGKSGDFIELVSKFKRITRKEAFLEIVNNYGVNFDPASFLERKKTSYQQQSKTEKIPTKAELPDKLYRIRLDDDFSKPYIGYLLKRKMSFEFINKCYYSFARKYAGRPFPFKNYVIIPYRDKFDNVVYWTARAVFDVEPKYYNCPLAEAGLFVWNIDTQEQTVVLCEGVFDAESFDKCGIAAGGKNITEDQMRQILARKFELIIIGGNNEEFEKAPLKMIETFKIFKKHGQKVAIFDWPRWAEKKRKIKDFNEMCPIDGKLTIKDLENFLIWNEDEAEVKYRLNRTYVC